MRPEAQQAIDFTLEKLRVKEQEVVELKKFINRFYTDEGEAAPYADVQSGTGAAFGALRSDHFYGMTLAEAAKTYLEMRKAKGLGSASVNDIYKVLKEGGYAFDTQNEEYAKNGLRISLKKNGSIFHKLPNNDYGLCVWYKIRGKDRDAEAPPPKRKAKKDKPEPKQAKEAPEPANGAQALEEISISALEKFVGEKNRRVTGILSHFDVTEEDLMKMLEPSSKVYMAPRGWLMLRK